MKIDVLGTKYTVVVTTTAKDKFLETCDGYCDKTTKKIVVKAEEPYNELADFSVYLKKVKRHEIIHAFLLESGLHENFKHSEWGHDETTVDWIAVQFPKLLKAFKDADAL